MGYAARSIEDEAVANVADEAVTDVDANVGYEYRPKSQRPTSPSKKAHARKKFKRRTIEFHPDIEDVLNELQQQLKVRSQTDVLQKAVQVLAILLGSPGSKRKKIYISREDGKLQELIII